MEEVILTDKEMKLLEKLPYLRSYWELRAEERWLQDPGASPPSDGTPTYSPSKISTYPTF